MLLFELMPPFHEPVAELALLDVRCISKINASMFLAAFDRCGLKWLQQLDD
jgi:hypothetical protein